MLLLVYFGYHCFGLSQKQTLSPSNFVTKRLSSNNRLPLIKRPPLDAKFEISAAYSIKYGISRRGYIPVTFLKSAKETHRLNTRFNDDLRLPAYIRNRENRDGYHAASDSRKVF